MGQGLRERCLPTPRPLAVFHRLLNRCPKEGYLLVEKVEGARELGQFVNDLDQLTPARRQVRLRRTIENLARLVRELHRRQLSHRDLKAANILVNGDQLWFIDLVGVRRHHKLAHRRRIQNLARIHASFFRHPGVTRADKVRFLKVYLQWGLFGREGWKSWWREIEQATLAKVARNVRVGRTLS
jgi:serine/threonine-protein kinase RIO1